MIYMGKVVFVSVKIFTLFRFFMEENLENDDLVRKLLSQHDLSLSQQESQEGRLKKYL